MAAIPALLDHLVYATPDLGETAEKLSERLGVRALPGGSHPAWGTRNAILPLGPAMYLEIIGPDAALGPGNRPVIFGLERLAEPVLTTWAAKAVDLAGLVRRAGLLGIELGGVGRGSRQRPDGTSLAWELTDPLMVRSGGVVPFFIDWGSSPHPGAAAPAVVALQDFHAEHPSPEVVRRQLEALGLDLRVTRGAAPRLLASLRTADGTVMLS
jgi:hypothetical protein